MKGKSLLFGLCLCLWTSLGWGQRVIEVPWYETTNTYMFDIIKMELTDEATVITGQVKYFPNEWFRVVGRTVLRGESGKEYKLLKAEGIELNEQVFLPESGQMTLALFRTRGCRREKGGLRGRKPRNGLADWGNRVG